jgi:hypothetical protein
MSGFFGLQLRFAVFFFVGGGVFFFPFCVKFLQFLVGLQICNENKTLRLSPSRTRTRGHSLSLSHTLSPSLDISLSISLSLSRDLDLSALITTTD